MSLSFQYEGDKVFVCAESIADLPLSYLDYYQKNYNIGGVRIKDWSDSFGYTYSPDLYKKVYGKMQDLVKGIRDDFSPEKKFLYVYRRMSKRISYDFMVSNPKNKREEKYAKENDMTSRNLVNGLLKGKCVCAGYSNILKNACLLMGIPAIEITGMALNDISSPSSNGRIQSRGGHAWNQIGLPQGWVQVDSTWENNGSFNFINQTGYKFSRTHSLGYTFDDFLRKDKHRVTEFDIGEFINKELGFPPYSYHYTDQETEKYVEEMERLDMVGLDMSSLRETIARDQAIKAQLESALGYSEEELLYYGISPENITSYKNFVSSASPKDIESFRKSVHSFVEEKKGDQVASLKFLGFTDEQIEEMLHIKFDPDTGKRVVDVVEYGKKVLSDELRSVGFSEFEISRILPARFNPDTGEQITNLRDFALNKERKNITVNRLSSDDISQIRKEFEGYHPVAINIITNLVNNNIMPMEEAKKLSDFLDHRENYDINAFLESFKPYYADPQEKAEIADQFYNQLNSVSPLESYSHFRSITLSDFEVNYESISASERKDFLSQISLGLSQDVSRDSRDSIGSRDSGNSRDSKYPKDSGDSRDSKYSKDSRVDDATIKDDEGIEL